MTAPDIATSVYRRLFGSEDFHSHYRWQAIRDYIDPFALRTLEVGCGDGLMTLEVARVNPNEIRGSEFDGAKVENAQRAAERAGLSHRVTFTRQDLRQLDEAEPFDQVLAIDVLEHIDDDEKAIREIANVLLPGGRLVVSVPTPMYPVTFGRDYHESIGHVRDGYWMDDLGRKLTAAGLRVHHHHYYTGPLVGRLSSFYYSPRAGAVEYGRALAQPLLRPVLAMAERRPIRQERASSLAVVAVKR